MAAPKVAFAPLLPAPDVEFWQELSRRKLDIMCLDDSAVEVHGYFEASPSFDAPAKCFMLKQSFDASPQFQAGAAWTKGRLKNFNTVEEFKAFLTSSAGPELVAEVLESLRSSINSGEALEDPVLLRPFVAVTFADLKRYHYTYTVAFPVLSPPTPWTLYAPTCGAVEAGVKLECLQDLAARLRSGEAEDSKLARAGASVLLDGKWQPLTCLTTLSVGDGDEAPLVAGLDPTSNGDVLGWPLRNLLVLLGKYRPGRWRILAFRDPFSHVRKDAAVRSRVFFVDVPEETASSVLKPETLPKEVQLAGWSAGPGGSKTHTIDLTRFLDKARVASDAVDLNIKLMKWRILPELKAERMKETKFLLLGSGTLGCSIARSLIGWGVRHITFLDTGKVSFSNPVRQSLFVHDDAVKGRPKAEAAAEEIQRIIPDARCEAIQMEIPMPGHPQSKPDVLRRNIEKLDALIEEHDVVCMLTDTRESRWLPSLMVAARQNSESRTQGEGEAAEGQNQPARPPPLGMTVALGFDSFLVSRQTYRSSPSACYFCNDVTAPSDSMMFRTLDQQCTVTRPGLSSMSAGVAAELIAALVQHEDGFGAPGTTTPTGDSLLGATPHQIRGYVAEFRIAPMETEPFQKCICCSEAVLKKYKEDGYAFVERIVQDSAELEAISGLKQMKDDMATREDEVMFFDDLEDLTS